MVQNEPRNPRAPIAGSSLSPDTPSKDAAATLKPPSRTKSASEPPGKIGPGQPSAPAPAEDAPNSPAWAQDLRQLYNAVVEEPLPDSIIELLSQLDSED